MHGDQSWGLSGWQLFAKIKGLVLTENTAEGPSITLAMLLKV